MFQPDRLLALNNSIGLLVVAALNPEHPDFESLIREFRLCLKNYDAWAEQFWTGTLKVEQVFTVGNDVRLSAPIRSRQPISSSVVMCSASGPLTLVHMFEAARFVPIGNTPVTLEPLLSDVNGVLTFGEPLRHTIGPSGILQVDDCERGQRYRITFFPMFPAAMCRRFTRPMRQFSAIWKAGCAMSGRSFNRSGKSFPAQGFLIVTGNCSRPIGVDSRTP